MTSPFMWYLNRGTGVTLMALMTLSTVFGVLATGRGFTPVWPRFLTQGLHRTLSGLSATLLALHAVTAVVDEYVDIRWWHALVPLTGTYEPGWLALGVLSLDLTLAVVVTSLLRSRISPRLWFLVHLSAYAAWAAGVVHGLGIGTDAGRSWFTTLTIVCVSLVGVAAITRIAGSTRRSRQNRVEAMSR